MDKKSNKNLIVIIEDEPDIVELVTVNLEKNGFKRTKSAGV